ncbi:DNA polymerase IV [Canibacter sp. lx-45]|uniref:DNA polymerase IV n=1 Tax=Canibacter zhuwentaonis TaxID=2837491 RepID=UPI001BDD913D|nr:DNA polymerase IV [Canibacter zhuwentaonis]MBT1034932.1 DNA polymerase IV [Canibacter zhuwentaonis]
MGAVHQSLLVASMSAPILHIDMDSFFVSVARLDNPGLHGKPVVVANDSPRSVVSSASYEARRFGVRSAMPVSTAKQICKNLVFAEPKMDRYEEISQQVFKIFERFTPRVEKLGIDEGFLDVAGAVKHFGLPYEIAQKIRASVCEELKIPCSVGLAGAKFVAKLASVKAKPDGIFCVPAEQTLQFLHPLKIGEMPGVGYKTAEKLRSRALNTVADLAAQSEESLVRLLGKAHGAQLYQMARGIDPRPVIPEREMKSLGAEKTLSQNTSDSEVLARELAQLAAKVTQRSRANGTVAETVTLTLRTPDLRRVNKSLTLSQPTNSTKIVYDTALRLLTQVKARHDAVRLIGVRLSGLQDEHTLAPVLWEDESSARWRKIDAIADQIINKLGGVKLESAAAINLTRGE